METITVNEENDKIKACNYSVDELIFKELCMKCQFLKNQNMKMLQERKDLFILNERNEKIYKRLLRIKSDYESHKSNLYKSLHMLKVSTEKQKILSRKKLDELYTKQKSFEEYYKVSPYKLELDELMRGNSILEEECKNQTNLFKLTKKQHNQLKRIILETFKKKVCEFCDLVLRLKAFNMES